MRIHLPCAIPPEHELTMTKQDGCSQEDQPRRTFRLGLAECLGLAFAAVMILALAANLITQKSEVLRTQFIRTSQDVQSLVQDGDALLAALADYHLTVNGALSAVQPASPRLLAHKAAAVHEQAQLHVDALFAASPEQARDVKRAVATYETTAQELLRRDQRRRALRDQYGDGAAAMEKRAQDALDGGWKIFGRVVARQSLVALLQAASELHSQAQGLQSPGAIDNQAVRDIVASEQKLEAALTQYEKSLRRSQGEAWLAETRAALTQLMELRQSLADTSRDCVRQQRALEQQHATIESVLLQQIASIRQRTPATTVTTETSVTPAKPNTSMLWLSAVVLALVLLISAATVYSVARPVRRLVAATRRVAQGEVDVLVPRGGLRELDGLALAFNSMAAQLAQARASVQAYQAQLEARVDERTRQLQHLAEHDPLTELPNRRQLLAHIDGALRAARADSGRVALLFIDLDNFKTLNDSLGHDFGDTLLQAVSQRLRQAVGAGFCARWGGDEFTVVLDGIANPDDARRRAFDVVAAFDRPLTVGARDVVISVSVGTSVFPDHAGDAEGLLRSADAALFRAKELGRRQAHLFDPQLLVNASSRFALEQALRRAVKFGEFELFYQPEVALETLHTTVVEALLRWRQPDGTYIAPGEFLVIAEQTGLIDELSDWVLRGAIRAAARWHRGPWSKARIAVNLSSRQLLDQQLVQRVEQLLHEYKLPAECLEIELTENVMQTGPSTIAALRALRALGVAIALDDFGTGYSSLTSLEQLPLTRVKIDRSLIASIDTSSRSASIARSIIGLCHSLGLQVTAEGIERPSQLAKLLADRGLHIQGYLLSKPLSGDELIDFIESAPARLRELVLTLPDTPFDPDSTGAYALRRYRAAVANRVGSPP